jgi:hypothetical protein
MIIRAISLLAITLAAPAVAIPPPTSPDVGPLGSILDPVRLPQRKSILQLNKRELASLRRGFAQMRAWNNAPRESADFRRSLQYWANMHAYFGEGCSDPAAMQGVAGLEGVLVWPAADPFSRQPRPWCQCEHNSVQFLTWHRMYLYYFERVLQAASGDPRLRLPYWDYHQDGRIPLSYRVRTIRGRLGLPVPNPLRVNARKAELNSGEDGLDPVIVDTSGAMHRSKYAGEQAAFGFNSVIEGQPHNAVHCAVGVSCLAGLMGLVESAALDPIFYSHHSNIDRLYDCWLAVDPHVRLPNAALHNQEYVFVDGDGSFVRRRVGDMLTSWGLGYRYTAGGGCPVTRSIPSRPVGPGIAPQRFPLQGEIRLQRGTTVVPLAFPPAARAIVQRPIDRLRQQRSILVLDRISYDTSPRVMYKLYLQPMRGARHYVGVLSFFNSTAHLHTQNQSPPQNQSLPLDITDVLRTQRGPLSLVIEPTTGLRRSTPAQAARRIDPRANVRIAAARIDVID